MKIKYGINKCVFSEDNKESTVVKFGDGMNRITSGSWIQTDNQKSIVGVQIVRPDNCSAKAFATLSPGDEGYIGVNDEPNEDKVYIVFDCVESINALISSLEEAKSFL
jgi:hypothetical protein